MKSSKGFSRCTPTSSGATNGDLPGNRSGDEGLALFSEAVQLFGNPFDEFQFHVARGFEFITDSDLIIHIWHGDADFLEVLPVEAPLIWTDSARPGGVFGDELR